VFDAKCTGARQGDFDGFHVLVLNVKNCE
jgi:hypothetical protein